MGRYVLNRLGTAVVLALFATLVVFLIASIVPGDPILAMLGDLASVTGGKLISEDLGLKLENVELADLGTAKRIVIDKDNKAHRHDVVVGLPSPDKVEILSGVAAGDVVAFRGQDEVPDGGTVTIVK